MIAVFLNTWISIFLHLWKMISHLSLLHVFVTHLSVSNQINLCPSLFCLSYFLFLSFSPCCILSDFLWSVFQLNNSLFCFVSLLLNISNRVFKIIYCVSIFFLYLICYIPFPFRYFQSWPFLFKPCKTNHLLYNLCLIIPRWDIFVDLFLLAICVSVLTHDIMFSCGLGYFWLCTTNCSWKTICGDSLGLRVKFSP